jgi:DNA replication licensing factor MCM2
MTEAFSKMRLSEFCSSQDIDRAIAVAVDSFVGSQKSSAKKALARAFAKYTLNRPGAVENTSGSGRRSQKAAA